MYELQNSNRVAQRFTTCQVGLYISMPLTLISVVYFANARCVWAAVSWERSFLGEEGFDNSIAGGNL